MAEVIRMPLLSDTMTEGKISHWNKKVGDHVKSDDSLADVETDKATMEVIPYVEGTLLYIGVEAGQSAKVNDIIAIIGKEGEDISGLVNNEKEISKDEIQPPTDGQANSKDDTTANAGDVNLKAETNKPTLQQAQGIAPFDKLMTSPANTQPDIPKDLTIIRMPLLSDTMTEGKIVVWNKKVGDKVMADDALADVETDKATMEVVGYTEGTLLYQGVEAGQSAKVNGVIAIVGKEGTDISPYLSAILAESAEAKKEIHTQKNNSPESIEEVPKQDLKGTASEKQGRLKASPLARQIAKEKGIDLYNIMGSGDNGRIVKKDLENLKASGPKPAIVGGSSIPNFESGIEGHSDTPLTQMRKIIAQKLSESKFSAPHFYLKISVEMDNLLNARKQINSVSPVKISINDMMIKACAYSLRKHPEVNSSWMGDFIRQNHHIHIGSAIALPEGLIVPVIKFADQKTLPQIAADANALYEKAKTKKIQPPDFTGNTFTISNLGMMDIDEFTAIINPPDACILAVGKISPTPLADGDRVIIKNIMKLTLSCDHRVVDGAVGAAFLQTLKHYLENPVAMLM